MADGPAVFGIVSTPPTWAFAQVARIIRTVAVTMPRGPVCILCLCLESLVGRASSAVADDRRAGQASSREPLQPGGSVPGSLSTLDCNASNMQSDCGHYL